MNWLTKTRIAWVLMVVILVGSLVGANRIMKGPRNLGSPNRDPAAGADKALANNAQRANVVPASGVIAPEGDTIPLIPSVKGEVMQVLVKTDDVVKKGQVLLRMDDTQARFDYQRAENGVKNAELLLKKAKDGLREWEIRKELQAKQIELAHTRYKTAYEAMERWKELMDKKLDVKAEGEYKMAVLKAEEAHHALQAEKKGLELAEHKKPTLEIEQAEVALTEAKLLRDKAKNFLEMHEYKAPVDGTIKETFVTVGWKFGDQFIKPAFTMYQGGLIVRADINQEWAHRVKDGMKATINDAGGSGIVWKGKVYYIGKSFLPKRDLTGALEGVNLLQQNQELVLECRIMLDPDQPAPFLNQKVRVFIGQ